MLNLAAVTEWTGKIPAPGFAGSQRRRSVAGAVAVITGGAAGIGRATAAELVRLGATVVIGDLDADAADRTAEEVGAAAGRRLDVTDRPAFTAFLDEVEAEFGPLRILVNNAGVMPLGRIDAEDDATTERILQVNLHGVIHGTREAVQRMAPRGKAGLPGGATYCATKFAVVGFCESVRAELAGTGVELTVVLPGVVETSLGEGVKQPLLIRRVNPEDVARGIAAAVQRPRFEMYIPFEAGPIAMLGGALPHGLRDRVARTLGLHETLAEADAGVRAAYEASVRLAKAAV
jgi:NADP-dependent 3-hydroxy acid dehydrogenase YdfG